MRWDVRGGISEILNKPLWHLARPLHNLREQFPGSTCESENLSLPLFLAKLRLRHQTLNLSGTHRRRTLSNHRLKTCLFILFSRRWLHFFVAFCRHKMLLLLQTGQRWCPRRLVFSARTESSLFRRTPSTALLRWRRILPPWIGFTRWRDEVVPSQWQSAWPALAKSIGAYCCCGFDCLICSVVSIWFCSCGSLVMAFDNNTYSNYNIPDDI